MKSWVQIILGCCIVSMGFVLFINPYHMVPGGIYGTSIILNTLFPYLQVGTYSYFLQIPLMLLSMWLLGKGLGVRTLFVVLFTPLVMNLLTYACYPGGEALQTLSPDLLLNGKLNLSDHMILAACFGGFCVGAGSGLIIKNQSGTGGTDLIGMLLHKYLHMKFTQAILLVDALIILGGAFATGSVLLAMYSLVAVIVLNFSLNFAMNGNRDSKIIYIICHGGSPEEDGATKRLREYILNELDHTATCIPCRGLYSQENKEMLMMVVHDKMVPVITKRITEFEPGAFLIVADAYNTYGLRWSKFPGKDELMLG